MIRKLNVLNKINFVEAPKLFSVILDQGLMSITTLLTTVILARTYDRLDYADLVLLFSIALFVLGFQSAIISKPYAISLNDFNGDKAKGYYHFNIGLKLVFTFGVFLIFPILYYISFEEFDNTKFFLFLLYIVSHSSYFFVRETLLSERKTKENFLYGLVCFFGIIILLLTIFYYKIQDIRLFLGISSVIYLGIALIYLLKNVKKFKVDRNQYLTYWSINWKVGKYLLGSNFLFYLSSGIYPWLLLYVTNKDDIAILGVLMSISGLINPILTALSSYLLPMFVKLNKSYEKINSSVKKWTYFFGLGAIFLLVIGYFLGEIIIVFLFGDKYGGLGVLVFLPFIVQSISIIFQPFKIALNAIKRTDVEFWTLLPRSIIAIVLGIYLIDKFGLIGVFYTKILESLIYQILHFIFYRRLIRNKFEGVI